MNINKGISTTALITMPVAKQAKNISAFVAVPRAGFEFISPYPPPGGLRAFSAAP